MALVLSECLALLYAYKSSTASKQRRSYTYRKNAKQAIDSKKKIYCMIYIFVVIILQSLKYF